MNVRRWLFRARNLNAELEATLRAKDNARATAERITASYSSEPRGGKTDFHAKLDNLLVLIDRCNEIEDKLIDTRVEILNAIEKLEDNRHKALLTDYYVNGLSWQEIADNMGYSVRQVTRLHGYALKALKDVLECPTQPAL